jgi:hypothetical protein
MKESGACTKFKYDQAVALAKICFRNFVQTLLTCLRRSLKLPVNQIRSAMFHKSRRCFCENLCKIQIVHRLEARLSELQFSFPFFPLFFARIARLRRDLSLQQEYCLRGMPSATQILGFDEAVFAEDGICHVRTCQTCRTSSRNTRIGKTGDIAERESSRTQVFRVCSGECRG